MDPMSSDITDEAILDRFHALVLEKCPLGSRDWGYFDAQNASLIELVRKILAEERAYVRSVLESVDEEMRWGGESSAWREVKRLLGSA